MLSTRFHFAAVLLVATFSAQAQSTLHDPYPISGDQARSIASNAAMGSTAQAGMRGGQPSAQELARRQAHKDEMKACRANYRTGTRGGSPDRKSARQACERKFEAQRATWYAKR